MTEKKTRKSKKNNVVNIETARKPRRSRKAAVAETPPVKAPKPGKVGSDEWYAKHAHVVKDSIRDASSEDRKALGGKTHGKVCTIKCVDSGEERVINTQDAFQVRRTVAAQHEYNKRRRAEKRAGSKKAKTA